MAGLVEKGEGIPVDFVGDEGVTVTVYVPSDLAPMAPHFEQFIRGMIIKLYRNKHKEPPRVMDGLRFLGLMQGEVAELAKQCYEDRSSPNLFHELHDVANYAFLMGLSLKLEQEDQNKRDREPLGPGPNGPGLWETLSRLFLSRLRGNS